MPAGLLFALAYVVRPTNFISLAVFGLYSLIRFRRAAWRFFVGATVVIIPFIVYSQTTYGSWLPPYYASRRLAFHPSFLEALLGNLVSPGRGLLVFSPVLAFALFGIVLCLRSPGRGLLHTPLAIIVGLHLVAISSFPLWWGGCSFGPRLWTDVLPYLLYFVAASGEWILSRSLFFRIVAFALLFALAGLGGAIHYRGANRWSTWAWNGLPVSVAQAPARVWDWSDLQFLR